MRCWLAVAVVVAAVACGADAFQVRMVKAPAKVPVMAPAKAAAAPAKVNADYCNICVNFMSQAIDQLLNAILQAGVAGGCGGICGQLPNQAEALACELICLYVGVDAFAAIVQYEDPDPIYICEELDVCTAVDGGAANITKAFVTPPSGRQGATFTLTMQYVVTKTTGPGYLSLLVIPPDGFPAGASEFTEGQQPGGYQVAWQLQAQPSEQEPFSPGVYQVQFAVCEGDCSTSHRWGGVYAQANTTFRITA